MLGTQPIKTIWDILALTKKNLQWIDLIQVAREVPVISLIILKVFIFGL